MALITTVGAADADSYATLAEAASYLATRAVEFDLTDWNQLSDAEKERRMKLAAMILDSCHRFRGVKCCKTQALLFPRLFPGDALWDDDMEYTVFDYDYGLTTRTVDATPAPLVVPFDTWTDLTDYADLLGVSYPTIPQNVKNAQVEIAFQVVHSHLLTLGPMEGGAGELELLKIDGVEFGTARQIVGQSDFFRKHLYGATSIIRLYLHRYIASMRGVLI